MRRVNGFSFAFYVLGLAGGIGLPHHCGEASPLRFKARGRAHFHTRHCHLPLVQLHRSRREHLMGKSWPFQKTKNYHEAGLLRGGRRKERDRHYVPVDYTLYKEGCPMLWLDVNLTS
jgi:hypothetical protein